MSQIYFLGGGGGGGVASVLGTANRITSSGGANPAINISASYDALWTPVGTTWSLLGNAGTNPAVNFIGTTDNTNLVFKANSASTVGTMILKPTSHLDLGDGSFHNLFIGNDAGAAMVGDLVNNHSNVFIGNSAGQNSNNCQQNTFVGGYAGKANTSGQFNTMIGDQAGVVQTIPSYNTGLGWQPLHSNVTAENCTALGAGALFSLTSGLGNNTVVGMQSMYYLLTGDNNSSLGYHAALTQRGSFNTFIGSDAGGGLSVGSGSNHVYIGMGAGFSLTSGTNNTVVGMQSMYYNLAGSHNVSLGYHAALNTLADDNTSIGYESGLTNSTGSRNVFLGFSAGYFETASDNLWIDNAQRASLGDGQAKALVVGKFASTTAAQFFRHNSNVGILTNTFGTAADGVLGINNGTVPSTSPANMIQIFSVDTDDGSANASLGLRTEQTVTTESVVSDRTLKITVNGTILKLCLKS